MRAAGRAAAPGPADRGDGPSSAASRARKAEAEARRRAESEAHRRKQQQAAQLQDVTGHAFPLDYAVKALEMSAGNVNQACDYLYNGQVEAMMKGSTQAGGAGRQSEDRRLWEQSQQMATISTCRLGCASGRWRCSTGTPARRRTGSSTRAAATFRPFARTTRR